MKFSKLERCFECVLTWPPSKNADQEIEATAQATDVAREMVKWLQNQQRSKSFPMKERLLGLHLIQLSSTCFLTPHLHVLLRFSSNADKNQIVDKIENAWYRASQRLFGTPSTVRWSCTGDQITRAKKPRTNQISLSHYRNKLAYTRTLAEDGEKRDDTPELAARRIAVLELAGVRQMFWASNADGETTVPQKPGFDAERLNAESILVFDLNDTYRRVTEPRLARGIQAEIAADALEQVVKSLPAELRNEWRRRRG